MMMTDKEPDNGINIKFGADRASKKGEYQLVTQNNVEKKAINGTSHKPKVSKKKRLDPDCEMVPPDGGWGWFVLVAAVIVNVLIPGAIKSFSVFYRAFSTKYNSTNSASSWIPSLCYFLYSSLGPLSSILSVKYSYRTVSLIGGTFAGVGMMITYFATSITFLYFSYGILVGIGAGLAFPPTVYIVTSYFVKLRGLANGFCISGSSLGSIIMPPIITMLLDEYDVGTAMLLMGAVTLNVWACALLYDPVEKHLVPSKKLSQRDEEEAAVLEPLAEAEVDIAITGPEEEKFPASGKLLSPMSPVSSSSERSPSNGDVKLAAPIVPKSASSVALENYYKPATNQARTRKISMPVSGREMAGQMRSTPALYAVPESQRLSRRSRPPPLSPSTSSFNYISTPYHGSTLTALHPEYASTLTLNAISSTFRKSPEKTAKQQRQQQDQETDKVQNKFFDCSLFKDPMYLIILISNSTNAISYTNFVIYIAKYCDEFYFSSAQVSSLISIISLFDLVGRIGGAALSDTRLMPKHWYFVGGLFISGVSLAILPSAVDYTLIMIYCSIFGLASGVYVGVTAVVMADMLGIEKLTSSYGISLFVNGLLQLIGPPICGAISDYLNSFKWIYMILGFILIFGAMLWVLVPFIRKSQAAAKKLEETVKRSEKL